MAVPMQAQPNPTCSQHVIKL